MDTDELTEEAYRVLIVRSGEISEFLMLEIGASARNYRNEYAFLEAMHEGIINIAASPQSFLFKWDLLEEYDQDQFKAQLRSLAEEILLVRNTPLEQRGPTGE